MSKAFKWKNTVYIFFLFQSAPTIHKVRSLTWEKLRLSYAVCGFMGKDYNQPKAFSTLLFPTDGKHKYCVITTSKQSPFSSHGPSLWGRQRQVCSQSCSAARDNTKWKLLPARTFPDTGKCAQNHSGKVIYTSMGLNGLILKSYNWNQGLAAPAMQSKQTQT